LIAAATIVLCNRGFNWGDFVSRNKAICLIYSYLVLSMVWSELPGISLKRIVKDFGCVLVGLVIAHLIALHEVGSNNPDGIEIKKKKDPVTHIPLDGIPFHPYYTVKDIVGVTVFLILFSAVIFFAPEGGGYVLEKPNFMPANPQVTPDEIAPSWYFCVFYAMLRAVPSFAGTQVWGVLVMGASIAVLFFVPWLDHSPVRSIRYRGPIYKVMLTIFVLSFVCLAICGLKPPAGIYPTLAKICTILYFAFFLLMPWYTKFDSVKPVPERVTGHA